MMDEPRPEGGGRSNLSDFREFGLSGFRVHGLSGSRAFGPEAERPMDRPGRREGRGRWAFDGGLLAGRHLAGRRPGPRHGVKSCG